MKALLLSLGLMALAGGASAAKVHAPAAPTATAVASTPARCHDLKGHFIKCPVVAAAPTPVARPAATASRTASATTLAAPTTACRDAKGHFTKCATAPAASIASARAATAAARPASATAAISGRTSNHCRNSATGRFAKCGAAGSVPA